MGQQDSGYFISAIRDFPNKKVIIICVFLKFGWNNLFRGADERTCLDLLGKKLKHLPQPSKENSEVHRTSSTCVPVT